MRNPQIHQGRVLRARSDARAAFSASPREELALSAGVDFLHLVFLRKPAIRFQLPEPAVNSISQWCEAYHYYFSLDDEGFCCVARRESLPYRLLEVDRRPVPHALELGQLLGYPRCCCRAIASIGERNIDERAVTAAGWNYEGEFRLINPARYQQGCSLICHLPCSSTCSYSLAIAKRALRVVTAYQKHAAFSAWSAWTAVL